MRMDIFVVVVHLARPVWLCDPMDCSTPGLPVLRHLLKFTQVHVHCTDDAIQASHSLIPSSPSALNFSQHQGLFQWVSCSPQMTKILEFQPQYQSFQWVFRGFPLRLTGLISLLFKGLGSLLQHHSLKASILKRSAFLTVWLLVPYVTTGKIIALTVRTFGGRVCLCFSTHCLGLSQLSFQEANIFWFQGCSHSPRWFLSPRRGNLTLLSPFPSLSAMK